ncbi:MAG: nicotinamide-nucleotide amidase [Candidatus Azotimanducaceae bacterium]|jgi:nicotinamide-nucleotide amidase
MFLEVASEIAAMLIERGETVSVAESSTGGLIAANLLSVAGASAYFQGGSVVYTLASRRAFLDLNRERLRDLKPLTEEMVAEFAIAARQKLGTTWGIAELGAAGPAGTPYGHGPGTSVIAISGPYPMSTTIQTNDDDRQNNMLAFTQAGLDLFKQALQSA